jgi:hypothetical protein
VQYHETIGDLKRKVAEKTGVPAEQQQARRCQRAVGRTQLRLTATAARSSSGTARSCGATCTTT